MSDHGAIIVDPILRFLWALAEPRSGQDPVAIWNQLSEGEQRTANTITVGIARAALRGSEFAVGIDEGKPGGDHTAVAIVKDGVVESVEAKPEPRWLRCRKCGSRVNAAIPGAMNYRVCEGHLMFPPDRACDFVPE